MELIIVGNGRLAGAVADRCCERKISWQPWGKGERKAGLRTHPAETVVIHAGTGRQLGEAIDFCSKHDLILLQGSSGLEGMLPKNPECRIIDVFNFSREVLTFIRHLHLIADGLGNINILPYEIVESHPAWKKTVSATACKMAEVIGLPASKIVSMRRRKAQLVRGVPREFLDGHAYHWVRFQGSNGVMLEFSSLVDGRSAYGDGAIWLAHEVEPMWSDLKPGIYPIMQFQGFLHA